MAFRMDHAAGIFLTMTGIKVMLTVNKSPEFQTQSLPGTTFGEFYNTKVEADGYPAPSFSVTNEDKFVMEEFGFTLKEDGTITGTAKKAGNCAISVYAENGISPDAVQILTIQVNEPSHPKAHRALESPYRVHPHSRQDQGNSRCHGTTACAQIVSPSRFSIVCSFLRCFPNTTRISILIIEIIE